MTYKYLPQKMLDRAFAFAEDNDGTLEDQFLKYSMVLGAFRTAREEEGLTEYELADVEYLLMRRRDQIGYVVLDKYKGKQAPKK